MIFKKLVIAMLTVALVFSCVPTKSQAYVPSSVTKTYQNKIVEKAQRWLGRPYVMNGSSWSGIDCSGLVIKVLSEAGVNSSLPHFAQSQYDVLSRYYCPGSSVTGVLGYRQGSQTQYTIGHVGIRVNVSGKGLYIHAGGVKTGVCYTDSSFTWHTAPNSWMF